MRYGCCGEIQEAELIRDAGFDFLEVNVQHVLQGHVADANWYGPDPDAMGIPIEAANCLVPGNLPVIGPKRDFEALKVYIDRVVSRAAKLGIHRLVFGSGKARTRPSGVSESLADQQIEEFTRMAGDACGERDITLVIEHLNKGECNTLNSLHSALRLADHINHPSVQVLVDSYHYGLEHESDQAILELGSRIRHVHIAEPVKRVEPGAHGPDSPDSFDFEGFFSVLHKVGYHERIAIEAQWTGPLVEKAEACRLWIKQLWERTGESM
ncbi:MAG: TIM barrel protein [Phycisphaeraceae bacterium]|nr:TIM barrel protein [Phycisphaeraceae bacterium]